MKEQPELKLCPLCGHEAGLSEEELMPNHFAFSIVCLNEHCCCATGLFALRKDAIEFWNRRPLDRPQSKEDQDRLNSVDKAIKAMERRFEGLKDERTA